MNYSRSLCVACLFMLFLFTFTSAQYDDEKALMAQYYNIISYCEEENIADWNCGKACEMHHDFKLNHILTNNIESTLAYTGVDHKAKQIVLSFRGSVSPMNYLDDIDFFRTSYNLTHCADDCLVHEGFLSAYMSLRTKVLNDIQTLMSENPDYTVLVSGHSLGGAMATLAALDIAMISNTGNDELKKGATIELYTFGSPRVGNKPFTNHAAEILSNHKQYRVVHNDDIVPQLPFSIAGLVYRHVPQEIWYRDYSFENYKQCNDGGSYEDPSCSYGVDFLDWSVSDHLSYFGLHTHCDAEPATNTVETFQAHEKYMKKKIFKAIKKLNNTSE